MDCRQNKQQQVLFVNFNMRTRINLSKDTTCRSVGQEEQASNLRIMADNTVFNAHVLNCTYKQVD